MLYVSKGSDKVIFFDYSGIFYDNVVSCLIVLGILEF